MSVRTPFSPQALLFLLLGLVSSGCATGSYLAYRLHPDYPRPRTETLQMAGLAAPVQVYFDAQGAPHLRAENERDLLRALGYVHGRERFFQMDMLRRIARGRVSELVGDQPLLESTTVQFDRAMRGWGLDEAAMADENVLTGEARELLAAYVAGVNAALSEHRPLEYRLLRVEPAPWTAADSFAVGRLNAWSITHNWTQELTRLLFALYGGTERADAIFPSRPWRGGVSIPLSKEARALPPAIVDAVRPFFPPRPVEETRQKISSLLLRSPFALEGGSNAWVVGGGRSVSGKPLLANDPHMTHFLPSLVFPQHLSCPGLDVIGGTLPGFPYVLFGRNAHVAWGITSAVGDAVDLFVEKSSPDRPGEVLTPTGWKPLEVREIVIRVRKAGRFVEKRYPLRKSHNGPIVNDIYPDLFPPWAPLISLRWDTTGAALGVVQFRSANAARTVEELRSALQGVVTPATVFTAADVHGAVALFAGGRLPIRRHHLGTFPAPGWLAEYQWQSFAPPEMLPAFRGGAGDRLSHANNLLWAPERASFPYHVDSAPSFRRDRIQELLEARPRHDPQSFAAIQTDVRVLRAKQILPAILQDLSSLKTQNSQEEKALALLRAWDLEARAESPAAALFFMVYRGAALAALKDELPLRARQFVLSQPYTTPMVDQWFEDPNHLVWDDRGTPARETRGDLVRAAFREAVAELARTQGPDPYSWHWGRLHTLHLRHFFGSQKAIASFVNLPRTEMPGGIDSVWKTHFHLGSSQDPFRVVAGPVFRMVVDLADPTYAWWVVETGTSGWPGSPHYGDQFPRWRAGKLVPMVSDWRTLPSQSMGLLTLVPKR
jgi:penicillin amidase